MAGYHPAAALPVVNGLARIQRVVPVPARQSERELRGQTDTRSP